MHYSSLCPSFSVEHLVAFERKTEFLQTVFEYELNYYCFVRTDEYELTFFETDLLVFFKLPSSLS